ncbi:MAG: hypothetical protein ACLROG_08185 [Coprococcus phoceensis]
MADINAFSIAKRILIHSQIDERTIFGNSLFSMFLLYSFIRKRGFLMDIDLKEELKKRDKLLAGYPQTD